MTRVITVIHIIRMNLGAAATSAVNLTIARTDAAMVNQLRVRLVERKVTSPSIINSTRGLAKKGVPLLLVMRHAQKATQ